MFLYQKSVDITAKNLSRACVENNIQKGRNLWKCCPFIEEKRPSNFIPLWPLSSQFGPIFSFVSMVRTQERVHSTALLSADWDTNVGLGEMFIRLVMNSVFFFSRGRRKKICQSKKQSRKSNYILIIDSYQLSRTNITNNNTLLISPIFISVSIHTIITHPSSRKTKPYCYYAMEIFC